MDDLVQIKFEKFCGQIKKSKLSHSIIRTKIEQCDKSLSIWKEKLNDLEKTLGIGTAYWGIISLESKFSNYCRLCIEVKDDGFHLEFLKGSPFDSFLKTVQCFEEDEVICYNGDDSLIKLAIKYRKKGLLKPFEKNQDFIDKYFYNYMHIMKRELILRFYNFLIEQYNE
ncbi:MAG: hypothetical protein PHF86_05170 [Candidatus Nanoarchaeia archaeon]|jgi:hypothetical protein|nr:hypothetical protein [Candidatus Nanoarchaeia archaeon]